MQFSGTLKKSSGTPPSSNVLQEKKNLVQGKDIYNESGRGRNKCKASHDNCKQ
uniref:Uncharacterized protein n=1 Tax=Arion vulgaris TaxID=1028688 RepID=A0A0B7BFR2_9EUPU